LHGSRRRTSPQGDRLRARHLPAHVSTHLSSIFVKLEVDRGRAGGCSSASGAHRALRGVIPQEGRRRRRWCRDLLSLRRSQPPAPLGYAARAPALARSCGMASPSRVSGQPVPLPRDRQQRRTTARRPVWRRAPRLPQGHAEDLHEHEIAEAESSEDDDHYGRCARDDAAGRATPVTSAIPSEARARRASEGMRSSPVSPAPAASSRTQRPSWSSVFAAFASRDFGAREDASAWALAVSVVLDATLSASPWVWRCRADRGHWNWWPGDARSTCNPQERASAGARERIRVAPEWLRRMRVDPTPAPAAAALLRETPLSAR